MDSVSAFFNHQPIVTLFFILAAGTYLGGIKVAGISLGASAVLFVAMALGHCKVQLPAMVGTLGLSFFVYAVGLHAGPSFVKNLRHRGRTFGMLALVVLGSAFATALGLGLLLRTDPALTTGVYCGAMTSTPSLAAALEVLGDEKVSVGYGVGYPFGLFGLIAFVYLTPRRLGIDLKQEASRVEAAARPTPVQVAWFVVENPLLEGHTLDDVSSMHLTNTLFSRLARGDQTLPARGEMVLHRGDHLRAVGTEDELSRLELLLGHRDPTYQEPPSSVTTVTLVVTEPGMAGQRLGDLHLPERYGVNVTRLWREEMEILPRRQTTLEYGDTIRVVGNATDCERLVPMVGHQLKRLQETPVFPLALALLAGSLLALVPFVLPFGLTFKPGVAGGALLAGLVAGHLGRLGPFSFRVPPAARNLLRELGLMLFLAEAGLHAGQEFWSVVRGEGLVLCLLALVLRTVPMLLGFLFAYRVLRWDLPTCLGAICGALTCTAGLGVVSKLADSELPSQAYVVIYPTALIGATLLAPTLGLLLRLLLPAG